ncbi:MAG TPA: TlpA disulfide reductase family protein [Acidimicrobiales bacterium]|nr:TlpA disulfide reductase family protein [Acidimicrobiales bacterium]
MDRRRPLSLRRLRLVAALAVSAALLTACANGGGVGFVATGKPAALPDPGRLTPASGQDFRSIVVGQRGKPVVVNIWASWCGPCRVEAPLLARAARHYGSKVVFLGVNAKDAPGPAARFITKYNITNPNIVDYRDDITQMLHLRGFPTTYIFDQHGRVRFSVVGGISEQTLAARLAQLLR